MHDVIARVYLKRGRVSPDTGLMMSLPSGNALNPECVPGRFTRFSLLRRSYNSAARYPGRKTPIKLSWRAPMLKTQLFLS